MIYKIDSNIIFKNISTNFIHRKGGYFITTWKGCLLFLIVIMITCTISLIVFQSTKKAYGVANIFFTHLIRHNIITYFNFFLLHRKAKPLPVYTNFWKKALSTNHRHPNAIN